jgi:hypothetical protein
VVEIDEWILDFAALFREHLGIDAEAHLDLHAEAGFGTKGLLREVNHCSVHCRLARFRGLWFDDRREIRRFDWSKNTFFYAPSVNFQAIWVF